MKVNPQKKCQKFKVSPAYFSVFTVCIKALRAPSLGEGCVILITVPCTKFNQNMTGLQKCFQPSWHHFRHSNFRNWSTSSQFTLSSRIHVFSLLFANTKSKNSGDEWVPPPFSHCRHLLDLRKKITSPHFHF